MEAIKPKFGNPNNLKDLEIEYLKIDSVLNDIRKQINHKKEEVFRQRCKERGGIVEESLLLDSYENEFFSTTETRNGNRETAIFHKNGTLIVTFVETNSLDLSSNTIDMGFKYY